MNSDLSEEKPRVNLALDYLLVWCGGALGTLLRAALLLLPQDQGSVSASIILWVINVSGSFFLGALLSALAMRTSEGFKRARLFLGTGFLGGFTTYSALSLLIVEILQDGAPRYAISYGLSTLVAGLGAAAAGYWFGRVLTDSARRSAA